MSPDTPDDVFIDLRGDVLALQLFMEDVLRTSIDFWRAVQKPVPGFLLLLLNDDQKVVLDHLITRSVEGVHKMDKALEIAAEAAS